MFVNLYWPFNLACEMILSKFIRYVNLCCTDIELCPCMSHSADTRYCFITGSVYSLYKNYKSKKWSVTPVMLGIFYRNILGLAYMTIFSCKIRYKPVCDLGRSFIWFPSFHLVAVIYAGWICFTSISLFHYTFNALKSIFHGLTIQYVGDISTGNFLCHKMLSNVRVYWEGQHVAIFVG